MVSRSLGHRAPLLWLAVPFIGGIILARYLPPPWPTALLLAAIAPLTLALVGREIWPGWRIGALVLGVTAAGTARFTEDRRWLREWEDRPLREAQLTLRADRVFPAQHADRVSGLASVIASPPHLPELRGQRLYFSLSVRDRPRPERGSRFTARALLEPLPWHPPARSFESFLVNAGMNFRFVRGQLLSLDAEPPLVPRLSAAAANWIEGVLETGLPERRSELAAVYRAMLLGQKHELSDEQETRFLRSGTMHVFAISGLHIGMIAVGIQAVLLLLRLPPLLRLCVGTLALWWYVEVTGATPSAMRAFLMVTLVQLTRVFPSPGNPLAAIAASALLVVVLWPSQVFSASFQLSYGIVGALLLLGLPLADAWQHRWAPFRHLPTASWTWIHHAVFHSQQWLLGTLAIGLATTLVSAVTGILMFQLFTPGALVANLLLIPASGLIILSGFLSILAGLVGFESLSSLCNHAAVLVLGVIDRSLIYAVDVPGTWYHADFIQPWIGPTSCFALSASLLWGYLTRWVPARGGWWPPFLIVGATLAWGTQYGPPPADTAAPHARAALTRDFPSAENRIP